MTQENAMRLVSIAKDLKRGGGYWSLFPTPHLAGWLLSGAKCVYCGVDLLEKPHTIDGTATVDHLLPRQTYPELSQTLLNLVPCCAGCNNVKRGWDPNNDPKLYNLDDLTPFTMQMREEFTQRAKSHISELRMTRAANFERDRTRWAAAWKQWTSGVSTQL
jgi:hypothetical protein